MTDYDSMNVHELVSRLIGGEGWFFKEDHIPLIESALRKAVIREATVGEVKVVTTEHFDEIARPEDPERIVTMSESIISQVWVPEGEYWLVKKEEK